MINGFVGVIHILSNCFNYTLVPGFQITKLFTILIYSMLHVMFCNIAVANLLAGIILLRYPPGI